MLERVNARTLTAGELPETPAFGIVTMDVSFISLRLILPVVPPLLDAGGDLVALVKPQFEAGPRRSRQGRHRAGRRGHAPGRRRRGRLGGCARIEPVGMIESPITGMEGNREILMHLRHGRGSARV